MRQSLKKLKRIPDAELCLRQAVLIRNTYQTAKQLSGKQAVRQLKGKICSSDKENVTHKPDTSEDSEEDERDDLITAITGRQVGDT